VIVIDRTFTEGELRDRTKSRRRRTVEVVQPPALELEALRPTGSDQATLVFPGTRRQPIDWRNWVHRTWRAASRAAGVDGVPYECRHTYASLLIHEGRPLPYGAAALGHSSATTTLDHYAHVFDEARLAPMTSMVAAIEVARAEVASGDVRPMFAEEANGVLRLAFEEG